MLLVFLGGLLFAAAPALSQEVRDRERAAPQEPSASESTSPNLPEWAEPSDPSTAQQSGTKNDSYSSSSDGTVQTRAPSVPGDPDQVPVDGGLALLAAAGAGYAVRRLRKEEEEEDPA